MWIEEASGARRGEEGSIGIAPDLRDEDARKGTPGKVPRKVPDEAMSVDDGTPRPADAPGPRPGAFWEQAEDVEEHVVGEADAVAAVLAGVHRDDRLAARPSNVCTRRRRKMQCEVRALLFPYLERTGYVRELALGRQDRKSTRLNSSHPV